MSESNFATLLDEMAQQEQIMAKAMKGDDDDDKDIAALADNDADDDGVPDAKDDETFDDDAPEEEAPPKKGKGKPLTKSVNITLADGSEVEAFDGTVLVKSMQAEVAALQQGSNEVMGTAVNLLKSFGAALREQRQEITALKKSLHTLSASGTGRRSATQVTITDRGAEPTGAPNPEDIKASVMAKAINAFDAHKINGLELTTIEVALRKGQIPDQSILAKIA